MSDASNLIRDARHAAGLTQRELAERLDMTQSAIAKLERPDANPTVATLDRVLRATEHRLQLIAPAWGPGVDVSLINRNLKLTMGERIAEAENMYGQARRLQSAVVLDRGQPA
jgi:transcriptional regulator with XRE-family HTH domain